jgi:hypothetical protein
VFGRAFHISDAVGINQPVEKVVVGSVSGLKELQNTSIPVENTTQLEFKTLK